MDSSHREEDLGPNHECYYVVRESQILGEEVRQRDEYLCTLDAHPGLGIDPRLRAMREVNRHSPGFRLLFQASGSERRI